MTSEATHYLERALSRDEVDARTGLTLLDFGTEWCSHCTAARGTVDDWAQLHPEVEHIRVEDGPGRRLGRSFRVKLWPSLILMRNGKEVARAARPRNVDDLSVLDQGLAA